MNSKARASLALYHQWFGERAYTACGKPGIINKSGVTPCSACGSTGRLHFRENGYHAFCDVCVTVAGAYIGIKQPGRMGGGWTGLITPDLAVLSTGADENMDAFKPMTNVQVHKNTVQKSLIRAIMTPPEPPFILIAFGNSNVDTCKQLRASYSKDLIYICGANIDRVDARCVRRTVSAIKEYGFPKKQMQQAASAYSLLARGMSTVSATEQAKKTLTDAELESPGITDLIRSMPMTNTTEYKWAMACAYEKE